MAKTKADHVLAIVKAGISSVPGVGGPISSLISDYVPFTTQRSIDKAIELLRQRLLELESRIDPETVNKDEFAELFKTCYLTIVRTHQESKLRGTAALIANVLLKNGDPDKLSYIELDHFARCLDALSVGAITVFSKIVEIAKPRDRGRSFGVESIRLDFRDISSQLPEMSPDLLMAIVQELNSLHLIHLQASPTVRTPDYANYALEVPPIARRFSDHVLELDAAKATENQGKAE